MDAVPVQLFHEVRDALRALPDRLASRLASLQMGGYPDRPAPGMPSGSAAQPTAGQDGTPFANLGHALGRFVPEFSQLTSTIRDWQNLVKSLGDVASYFKDAFTPDVDPLSLPGGLWDQRQDQLEDMRGSLPEDVSEFLPKPTEPDVYPMKWDLAGVGEEPAVPLAPDILPDTKPPIPLMDESAWPPPVSPRPDTYPVVQDTYGLASEGNPDLPPPLPPLPDIYGLAPDLPEEPPPASTVPLIPDPPLSPPPSALAIRPPDAAPPQSYPDEAAPLALPEYPRPDVGGEMIPYQPGTMIPSTPPPDVLTSGPGWRVEQPRLPDYGETPSAASPSAMLPPIPDGLSPVRQSTASPTGPGEGEVNPVVQTAMGLLQELVREIRELRQAMDSSRSDSDSDDSERSENLPAPSMWQRHEAAPVAGVAQALSDFLRPESGTTSTKSKAGQATKKMLGTIISK